MSDSSRPHGLQPTRLLHPWDFPGKSTGVECHCLLLPNSKYHQMISYMDFPGKFLHHVSCQVRNILCLITQLCLILCYPMNCSAPGSSIHGILQARILKWVAIPFSREWFPYPGIKPRSPALQADSLLSEPAGKWR